MLLEEGFSVTSVDASDKMLKYALKERWERRKEEPFDKWGRPARTLPLGAASRICPPPLWSHLALGSPPFPGSRGSGERPASQPLPLRVCPAGAEGSRSG